MLRYGNNFKVKIKVGGGKSAVLPSKWRFLRDFWGYKNCISESLNPLCTSPLINKAFFGEIVEPTKH